MQEPRPYNQEEVRSMFLAHVRNVAAYWAENGNPADLQDMCEGVVFSILSAIDGCAGGLPFSIDLVARVHQDDKAFHLDNGDNWIEDGTVLNADCMMHDLLHNATG